MKTLKELEEIRKRTKKEVENRTIVLDGDVSVVVSMGTCGIAAGAREVLLAAQEEVAALGLEGVKLMQVGNRAACNLEPLVEVKLPKDKEPTVYINMTPKKMKEVVKGHIIGGEVIKEYAKS